MKTINRIKTNIEGFDKLIEGGFVKGSSNLILGDYGTGKTIFSMQYLYNGAKSLKEIGIYFTFEEKKESLIEQAIQFGWDLEKLEKKGKLKIISLGFDDINTGTVDDMINVIKDLDANRVVIDSISTLSFLIPKNTQTCLGETGAKRFIYEFMTKFKELKGITALFISQESDDSVNEVAKYAADSVIKIDYETLGGDFSRNLTIRKMRKTKNDEDLHPLEISGEKGIIIHDLD